VSAGYYQRRRGILEHLESGTIGLIDLAIHDYLCLKMNSVIGNGYSIPAGVCITSAAAIHAFCREVPERSIRRSLEHLEKIGWIKRWTTPGKHGNYPILVARGAVRDLSGNEYRVNAEKTEDWRFPVCDLARSARGDGQQLSANKELRSKNKEKTKAAAKNQPPSDPRTEAFLDFAYKEFEAKHGVKPSWAAADFVQLDRFLKSNPEVSGEEMQRRFRNYLASTEPFTIQQGGSLMYFIRKFVVLAGGPIHAPQPKGGSNGRVKIEPAWENKLSDEDKRKLREYGVVGGPIQ
jgi:hypothetical protein